MIEAKYYTKINSAHVKCGLCPHECLVAEGKAGICNVRRMHKGVLYSETYGKLSSIAIDPIEKKPLYHFYPGSQILSIGTLGCTMRCSYCQNSEISQFNDYSNRVLLNYSVKDIINQMERKSLKLVAFTYNEPVVFYEFMLDAARAATSNGFKCAMISNGYIQALALEELIPHIAAFNVDLKAYNDKFYKTITGASLKPIINSIELIKSKGKHLEITYLVIPGENDDADEFFKMVKFISKNFGRSQILHLSRYFPNYKMNAPPTPLKTMRELTKLAKSELDFVYPGNTGMELDSNTYCPGCGSLLIERINYRSTVLGLSGDKCTKCEESISGKFV